MIKHPTINTDNVKVVNRTTKQSLEWGNYSINLAHLKSFKRGAAETKDSIVLSFPYSEVEVPCHNHAIMLKVMDELQAYLEKTNMVDIPVYKEAKEKVISPVITPNQVIKLANKKQIPLIGLKDIGSEGVQITLYYEHIPVPQSYRAQNNEEAELIVSTSREHINKMQLLKIFKNLQANNPFTSPVDLWSKAEETQALLIKQSVHPFY